MKDIFFPICHQFGNNNYYFTNIPEQELAGRDVAALYAARWNIENLFQEVKSKNFLGQLKSKIEEITDIFVKILIIWLITKNANRTYFKNLVHVTPYLN